MNFLWIYQTLVINFILKIYFPFIFSDFRVLWTGPQLMGNAGAKPKFSQGTDHWRLECGLISFNHRVSLAKVGGRRGIHGSQPPDPLPTVQIRFRFKWSGMQSWSLDQRSTVSTPSNWDHPASIGFSIYGHGWMQSKRYEDLIQSVQNASNGQTSFSPTRRHTARSRPRPIDGGHPGEPSLTVRCPKPSP
jgi:hypothetical protein